MTSKLDEIRRLLSLYYAGTSTIDEERSLAELMESLSEIPEDIADDRDIILAAEKSRPAMPPSLPLKLDAMIAGLGCGQRRHNPKRIISAIAGCAATAALLIGIGWVIRNSEPNPYEVTDPKTAFNETRRALLLVSDGLNSTDEFINEINTTLAGLKFAEDNIDDEYDDEFIHEEITPQEL